MKNNKKNKYIKPIPYSEESLGKKEFYLKILLSLLEALLLLPVANPVYLLLDINIDKTLFLIAVYLVIAAISYVLKNFNKKYDFSKWDFLDDEVILFTNDNSEDEASSFCISKFIFFLIVNIIVIIPLSLTFSTILASTITFIFTFFIDAILVDIVKFLLIPIIFKEFFNPLNEKFITYISKEKL